MALASESDSSIENARFVFASRGWLTGLMKFLFSHVGLVWVVSILSISSLMFVDELFTLSPPSRRGITIIVIFFQLFITKQYIKVNLAFLGFACGCGGRGAFFANRHYGDVVVGK